VKLIDVSTKTHPSVVVLVDDEDYERLNTHNWFVKECPSSFYANRSYHGGLLLMHREILGLRMFDGKIVDHINHNGLDNRRENLRICSYSQNQMNLRPYRRRMSSQFKGVHFLKKNNKWVARIGFNNRRIYLGCFEDEIDAAETYDQMAIKLFGEYAYLNFPERITI